MNLKQTYLDDLVREKQNKATGPHREATSKVVDAKTKKSEVQQRAITVLLGLLLFHVH